MCKQSTDKKIERMFDHEGRVSEMKVGAGQT